MDISAAHVCDRDVHHDEIGVDANHIVILRAGGEGKIRSEKERKIIARLNVVGTTENLAEESFIIGSCRVCDG